MMGFWAYEGKFLAIQSALLVVATIAINAVMTRDDDKPTSAPTMQQAGVSVVHDEKRGVAISCLPDVHP